MNVLTTKKIEQDDVHFFVSYLQYSFRNRFRFYYDKATEGTDESIGDYLYGRWKVGFPAGRNISIDILKSLLLFMFYYSKLWFS